MLTKSVIKRIRRTLASTRSAIRQYRGVNVIAKQLEHLVDIEGWKVSISSNSFDVDKVYGHKVEGETDLQFFLNMVGIVNDALGENMRISTGTSYDGKPSLSASLIVEVKPRLSQRLPVIRSPRLVINDKILLSGKELIKPKQPMSIYVFVSFGASSDCEFVVETETETITHKKIKLVGDCADAIAAMNQ